jgi:hypothetical protein
MKKILVFLMFSVLLVTSSVFAQKGRSIKTKSIMQSEILQSEISQNELVVYSSAEAFSDGRGVWLEWQTSSETKNLGFFLYRQTAKGRELVSQEIIGGGYLRAGEDQFAGDKYTYFDRNGSGGAIYYIESYSTEGQRRLSNPIYPKYVSDLKEVGGARLESLRAAPQLLLPTELSRSVLNLPADLQETINAYTIAPDIITQRWVAAQAGVKIGVKKEGFYRISKAALQSAGFDVNSSPANWQLYLNGNEQGINIVGNGDFIEFYGKGIDTRESDTQIYYLIAGAQNGKRMGTRIIRSTSGNVQANSFAQTYIQRLRKIYISDLLNGDEENFFDNIPVNTAGRTLNFTVNSIDFSIGQTPFTVGIQGLTLAAHQNRIVLNGHELGTISGSDHDLMTQTFNIPTNYLLEGANTLQVFAMGGASDVSFLASVKASHSRLYEAKNNQLSFYSIQYRTSNLTGFTSPNIRVFDISFPTLPTLITNLTVTQNGGTYSVRLPSNRSAVMYAVEDSAVLTASDVSIVPNIPSSLSTTGNNASFIVITHKDFINEANTWANYRQAQGLSTKVIDIEDVYDEFSYGVHQTDGIRGFLEYAKNNWQTPPQYALLLGDAHYDYRNYENATNFNYVPTRLVDTVYMETGSDEALADFNDDGLAEVAIGRIPARDAATVTQAFNKMTSWEFSTVDWINRGALFVSDMPIGYDFEALSARVRDELPQNMPTVLITRRDCINPPPPEGQTTAQCLEEQRTNIRTQIGLGKYIVNYSGHGSTGFWATNNPAFFNMSDATSLSNNNNYSLFTMLTCLNGYFLNTNDSLAEALMKAPTGGAAASWTSTGKTTPDVQEVMAARFFNQVTLGNMPRIGDLIKDAKTAVAGGRDVRLSWALIGDPAMKVR